jgi:hypothetical protein
MAKNESGVPGSAMNGDENAAPYTAPKQGDTDVSFIKGFGTPSPKSIEGKIDRAGGQQKKAVE